MAVASGRAQVTMPPKQLFTDPETGGDFRVMPCELRSGNCIVKTVKLIGTNTLQRTVPDQITVGKLFALDPGENFVSAIFEACLLSSARTGACAALAISALAPKRERLVVVGSGRVGYYAGLYAIAASGVGHITFCDRIGERAQETARWFSSAFPAVRSDARQPHEISSADVVVLATTSDIPVASPPCWDAGLVVSLGADADTQSELDPAWTQCADIYCDTLDSLRFGDLRAWTDGGRIEATAVFDLLHVLRHPPPPPQRARIFISTGSALLDNFTARYLLESHSG